MTGEKNRYSYLAAFDLDKTLLSINSSRLVVQEARKQKFMRSSHYNQAIYYSILYKFDLKDPVTIVRNMMQWINGLNEQEFDKLLNQYCIEPIIKSIRPVMHDLIRHHREEGGKVILLSSAMTYICHPVAEAAGMDDVVCSRLEVVDGHFTGNTLGPLVFGPEKRVRMLAYCREHGFVPAEAWYYGDAFTDHHVMEAVGHPVCVQPEIRLRSRARKKGWKIM